MCLYYWKMCTCVLIQLHYGFVFRRFIQGLEMLIITSLGFPGSSMVKNPPATQEMWVRSLGKEDPLEEQTASHSNILAWEIPWTEEPGRILSMGLQRVRHDCVTKHTQTHITWPHVNIHLVVPGKQSNVKAPQSVFLFHPIYNPQIG